MIGEFRIGRNDFEFGIISLHESVFEMICKISKGKDFWKDGRVGEY